MGVAFRIRTDSPVVAYQMLPYGGGSAALTGSTLLLPTSAYGTNYVAVSPATPGTVNVVAALDDTTVTIRPKVAVQVGGGVEGTAAGVPHDYRLHAGQVLQISQFEELTGSPILADKPIGVLGGAPCMTVPEGRFWCDHGEQQIPPVSALASEYVAVSHRQRSKAPETPPWKIIGTVAATKLVFDPPVSGPRTVGLGDVVEIKTATPFVVRSQDASHPFVVLGYMTGSSTVEEGYGDPEVVRMVPPAQFLDAYVFFTDPTYPETNLVVTRKKGGPDVELDCAGVLGGWQAIDATYEMTRIDLVRHDFEPQGRCDNGRHVMKSTGPFGLTVWGWGSTETVSFTRDVSYAYAAGEDIAPINTVVVPPK
jgi:hypothetical protein